MSYNVVLTPSFKHSVRKLQKRFRHVKDDVGVAVRVLLQTPRLGAVLPSGSGVRKLRCVTPIWAKAKGVAIACCTTLRTNPCQPSISCCYMPSQTEKTSPDRN